MGCRGCARRKQQLLTGVGWVARAFGRPIPRRSLDAMTGVQCRDCGFTADGVCFAWSETKACGYCPKCRSFDLTPGSARV